MDCEFTEKVSLLLDAELTREESLRVTDHIRACPACRQAEEDFLRLRREIKAYDFQPQPSAQAGVLARILHAEKPSLWRRGVNVPLPLMASLLAIIIALGVWSAALRRAVEQPAAPSNPTPVQTHPQQAVVGDGGDLEFSHYDHGERAAIYKVHRTETASPAPTDAHQ